MSLNKLKSKLSNLNLSSIFGVITKISANGMEVSGLRPRIGDVVKIVGEDKTELGMVTQIHSGGACISPFGFVEGFKIGDKVFANENEVGIPVGPELLGRVVDPFMNPKDGKGAINADKFVPILRSPIDPMKRGLINETFPVGIKAIDGLLTCGKGQKLGIFAGSGVGKSTLMGKIGRASCRERV